MITVGLSLFFIYFLCVCKSITIVGISDNSFTKNNFSLFHLSYCSYLCTCNGSLSYSCEKWLKGNQVKILNRPAAVSSFFSWQLIMTNWQLKKTYWTTLLPLFYRQRQPATDDKIFHCPLSIVHCQFTTGRRSTTGASQKTCHANFCSAFIQERKGLCFQAFGDKLQTNAASVFSH